MNILIVEDEVLAADNLKNILLATDPDIHIVDIVDSVMSCVKWLSSHKAPDVIFMDIELSDGSAFDIFNSIEVTSPVIFTTAYDQYALQAFKTTAIDYIMKPIDPDEVKASLESYTKRVGRDILHHLSDLFGTHRTAHRQKKLLVGYRDKLIPVDTETIVCIHTSNKDTDIYLEGGKRLGCRKSLDSLYDILDPYLFYRANKQFIISKKYIRDLIVWPDNRLMVEMSEVMPEHIFVSKNRSPDFRQWITGSDD
jgi:DNA-binding LytR/AlgR family response regulator